MPLVLTIAVGVALIVLGVVLLRLGRDRKRYFKRAAEAGTDLETLNDVYHVYSVNKSLTGHLAIWLGVGLILVSVVLPLMRPGH